MSTMVVKAGLATNAGSSFKAAAPRGSKAPMMVDVTTWTAREIAIAKPMSVRAKASGMEAGFVMKTTRRKARKARTRASNNETLNSFQTILRTFLGVISLRASARTITVADWLPVFPPVSISMGI